MSDETMRIMLKPVHIMITPQFDLRRIYPVVRRSVQQAQNKQAACYVSYNRQQGAHLFQEAHP